MDEFTEEERRLLQPFVSNFDKPVFVLRNLPEVVKGALFSRYSRSTKSLRRTLLDEFIKKEESGFGDIVSLQDKDWKESVIATQKAERFYDRVLVGYGDDSVAELAGAHIALEDISIVATKIVEDARLGLSPLEKSTRYVYFDQKEDGKYRFYREPTLMEHEGYESACDLLFDTYSSMIPKVSAYFKENLPQGEGISDRAYEATIRAKTCDVLRGLLPASTKTNMGFFGNGRSYEYLITKMYADELSEIRDLAASMQEELRTIIPAFVKRPDTEHGKEMQAYLGQVREGMRTRAKALGSDGAGDEVVLVDFDGDAEEKVLVSALYPHSGLSMAALKGKVAQMDGAAREEAIAAYIGDRKNRRHRPGRGFELASYTFDICANFGAYRDLHRHRVLTQQRQLLGCGLGYRMPDELVDAGYESEFREAMDAAKAAWETLSAKHPVHAQYVVPLAYNIRWQICMNLREAYHLCELRSARQGHIDYRLVAQRMFKEIERVHPRLAKGMRFMDMERYEFERLEAEKRLDRKIRDMEKEHG